MFNINILLLQYTTDDNTNENYYSYITHPGKPEKNSHRPLCISEFQQNNKHFEPLFFDNNYKDFNILYEVKGFTNVTTTIGRGGRNSSSHRGSIQITLPDSEHQIDSAQVIQQKLRAHFDEYPGAVFLPRHRQCVYPAEIGGCQAMAGGKRFLVGMGGLVG